jgi:FkbM family methyltransferase
MRGKTRHFLGVVARTLPMSAKEFLLHQAVTLSGSWHVLAKAAASSGVVAFRISGDYGLIQGSPADHSVLGTYARTGRWASRTNALLKAFFRKHGGGQYVDIGANIGLTTIPVAQDPRVACIAIEPDPTNFAHLITNVATNCQHGNVALKQVAIFAASNRLTFELSPRNLGDHRLRLRQHSGSLGEHNWSTIQVETAPLDAVARDARRPLAVKIDTQGAEPFVFAGGPQTLGAADLIVVEWAPYLLNRLGGDPSVVTNCLRRSFTRISIAAGEDQNIPPSEPVAVAIERLLEMAHQHSHDPRHYVDLIAEK